MNTTHIFDLTTNRAAFAVAAAALLANVAIAQPAPVAAPDARTRVNEAAPAGFKSAFDNYQSYTDDKTVNWKAANDTAAQIGGWRAYAKEASGTEAAPLAPAGNSGKKP